MDQEIVRLLVGFALTTVLGGVLGSYLQQRSWKHQNNVLLKVEELKQAKAVCESISQLLDKRLYRMLRLYYACDSYVQKALSKEVLEQRLQDYDGVLYEWNDRLNLNLALIGAYFGKSARDYLDFNIYEHFKSTGSELEQAYRTVSQDSHVDSSFDELASQLDRLNDKVYRLGVFMMTQLREGQVGGKAPRPLKPDAVDYLQ